MDLTQTARRRPCDSVPRYFNVASHVTVLNLRRVEVGRSATASTPESSTVSAPTGNMQFRSSRDSVLIAIPSPKNSSVCKRFRPTNHLGICSKPILPTRLRIAMLCLVGPPSAAVQRHSRLSIRVSADRRKPHTVAAIVRAITLTPNMSWLGVRPVHSSQGQA